MIDFVEGEALVRKAKWFLSSLSTLLLLGQREAGRADLRNIVNLVSVRACIDSDEYLFIFLSIGDIAKTYNLVMKPYITAGPSKH